MPTKTKKPNPKTRSSARSSARRKRLPEGVSMDDLIRRRAYAIFQARGEASSNSFEDWLRAEREVRSEFES